MADALHHRGPDAAGSWSDPELGVALAHRRLAILELSPAGHQPMLSASGRYVIAFNGEIYNHLDLRRELECSGVVRLPWRGHSDTETLLAAIEAWGLEQALQRSSGMLSLALVDRQEHLLHLARDRFGEKPLYYGLQRGTLRFASELSAFRADPTFAPQLDPLAVDHLLRCSYVPVPLSIDVGVSKLPPGHLLTIPLAQSSLQKLPAPQAWWRLREVVVAAQQQPINDPEHALTALEAGLEAAVHRQSLADVPLGCFLSGGIDSTLIAALMQRQSGRPIRTFTIGFNDVGLDESPHAAAVASHIGSDHTSVQCSDSDALALVPRMATIHAEPFADASQVPTQLLCQLARQTGLKVCLSGDGGDELFGGYARYGQIARRWRRLQALPPGSIQLLGAAAGLADQLVTAAGSSGLQRRLARATAQLGLYPGNSGQRASLLALHQAHNSWWGARTALLQPEFARQAPSRATSSWHQEMLNLARLNTGFLGPRGVLMALETIGYLPDDLLVKVDRAAMAVGLETRAPFLDPAVTALAWQCPNALHFRDGQGKWLLRTLLKRHVPMALTSRPKSGFTPPLGAWLRGPLHPWAAELLDPHRLERQGLLRPQPIQQCWQAHLQGRSDQSTRLWPVLMLQAWLDHWMPA